MKSVYADGMADIGEETTFDFGQIYFHFLVQKLILDTYLIPTLFGLQFL